MSVCAVLVNYRNAREIVGAVASVLADASDTEVVVVDNSDDDAEWALLNALLPASVRRIRAPGNIGFGQGCNLALEQTNANFVFLVNPDVQLVPGCTQALRACLEDDTALGAVSPQQFLDSACTWRLPPSWLPTVVRAWVAERALHEPKVAARLATAVRAENLRFWQAENPVRQRALSGAAMMVRRAALAAEEPLFDPRYFMYFEDTDLCMRLRRSGWALAVLPSARAVHAWRHQHHKAALMEASAQLYFGKFFPGRSRWAPRTTVRPPIAGTFAENFERFVPAGISLPAHWRDDWVLELSPSPLLHPAVALLGAGTQVPEPLDTLAHFEMGTVYGRLSRLSVSAAAADSLNFLWPAQDAVAECL